MMKKTDSLTFDTDIYNTIRRNIRKYRQESGLTAAELAELVGRSHDFIRQIESEKWDIIFLWRHFTKYRLPWVLVWTHLQVERIRTIDK